MICEEIIDRAGRPINPAKRTVMKYGTDQEFHPDASPEKPVAPVVQETILRLAHRLMKRRFKHACGPAAP
jgi:hypothetical protein